MIITLMSEFVKNGSKQVDIVGTDNDSDIGFYFTGDVNLTGVKVDNDGTVVLVVDGTTYYRWGNSQQMNKFRIGGIGNGGEKKYVGMKSLMVKYDVTLSFPADSNT